MEIVRCNEAQDVQVLNTNLYALDVSLITVSQNVPTALPSYMTARDITVHESR